MNKKKYHSVNSLKKQAPKKENTTLASPITIIKAKNATIVIAT